MKTYEIYLKSIVDVKNFVNTTNRFDFDIDLESGRYVVDAKSIMGIFSLDLSKPLTMHVHAEVPSEFDELMKQFK
ncbi:MAG: HPr family phosphocarrier protein [Clostridia bacterium]|nr:HPr family phosphocarrier protein [Clostridia bacterium]MBQ6937008.1 HPr family phosphocarrier protein [Clostridia bacterium]MBR2884700.1 HPr family phosphocarrier protein [Clostridia bacterium]